MRVTKTIKAEQLKLLQEHYFDAKPALDYTNEFELLVAGGVSAPCAGGTVLRLSCYLHSVRMNGLILLLNDYSLS